MEGMEFGGNSLAWPKRLHTTLVEAQSQGPFTCDINFHNKCDIKISILSSSYFTLQPIKEER